MLASALAAIIGILAPLLAGYHVVSFLRNGSPGERTALGLLTGYAVLIFILTWASAFVGSGSYAWIVCGSIAFSFFLHPRARRQFIADFTQHFSNPWNVAAGFCAFLFVAFLNIQSFLPGAPLFYESETNHDCLHWVIAADILTETGYLYPQTSHNAGKFIFEAFSGWWGFDTRLGSELILSWLADLTGARPALIFNTVVASLYFGWVSGIWLLMKRLAGGLPLPSWSFLLVVSTQPAFVFFVRFGNVPNLLGIILAAGLVAWGFREFENRQRPIWLRIGPSSLCLSAVLAVYPEILPFFLPAYAVAMGIRAFRASSAGRTRTLLVHLAGLCVLGALWNPISTIRGIGTVWSKSMIAGKGLPVADIFAFVDPAILLPSWIAIDRTLGDTLDAVPAVMIAVALVIAALIGFKRSKAPETGLLGLLILFPLLTLGFTSDIGYLKQKAIQFSAVFVYAWILYGIVQLLRNHTDLKRRIFALGIAAITISFLSFVMWRSAFQAHRISASKYISGDTFELGRNVFPGLADRELLILDASFENSFFYGAWLPYALEACRTSLPESPDQARWYHDPWPSRMKHRVPEFVISSVSPHNRLFRIEDDPVYRNKILSIHLNELGQIKTRGLLLRQGSQISLADHGAEIEISGGFGWNLNTEIVISSIGEPCLVEVSNNGKISTIETTGGLFRFSTPLGTSNGSIFKISVASRCAQIAFQEISFSRNESLIKASFNGLHAKEPDRVWMTERVSTRNDRSDTVWLNLRLIDKFNGLPEDSHLHLKTILYDRILNEDALRTGRSIALPPASTLILESTGGAISPAQLGYYDDKRPLSYAFSIFEVTKTPFFQPLDPTEVELPSTDIPSK